MMTANTTKTECDRCGTCCINGGPALHYEDITLLQNNIVHREHLITIRKGEPVFSPGAEKPEPAESELVKIKGKGIEWVCIFFKEKEAACAIYDQRPLECTLLKCWETNDLEKVAGQKLLSRHDIIAPDEQLLPFLTKHDDICSLENLDRLLTALDFENSQQQAIIELTALVNAEMALRAQAHARFHLSLDLELFYFGRPLFKILDQFGIMTYEENGVCRLYRASSLSSERLAGSFTHK